jgi:FKBP-type peptidyl-prolyl cis-trans isomerase
MMKLLMKLFFVVAVLSLFTACLKKENDFNQGAQNRTDDVALRQYLDQKGIVANKDTLLTQSDTTYLYYQIDSLGTGASPMLNDTVTVKLKGTFLDGTTFMQTSDTSSVTFVLGVGDLIVWEQGLQKIKPGGGIHLYSPSVLAFGYYGNTTYGVPGNTPVIFNMQLLDVKPAD